MSTAPILQLREGEVSRWVCVETRALDDKITEALQHAKEQGIPQGLIVALLQAHALRETQELITP